MGFISDYKEKIKLRKVFYSAGLFLTYKNGDKEIKIYPKIHAITNKPEENKTEITFTLPRGINPTEIKKKEYVFLQEYGKQIKIDGDIKKFVLNIYHNPLPSTYKYKYEEFHEAIKDMKLPFILGRNINGQIEVVDLAVNPHILIAGETGSGKSSLLRVALTSLITLKKPHELKIWLADCKRSEFSIFKNAEIVQCVHYKDKDILKMLVEVKKEMEKRMELTDTFGVNHINDLPKKYKLPYCLVVIDEFVMLRHNQKIMSILVEIVAIGRSLGVIAALSLQKPTHNNLDTSIRDNLTVRVGFKVANKINANVIGVDGAEKIKEPGVMKAKVNGDLMDIKAPLLEMEKAKKLLDPFCIAKGDIKDVTQVTVAPEQNSTANFGESEKTDSFHKVVESDLKTESPKIGEPKDNIFL